jgi:hypothetical protein
LPGRRRRPNRRPSRRRNHSIGARPVPAAADACASSRPSNVRWSRARRPRLPQQPGRRHDPARQALTSRRNAPCSGDRHLRALRQLRDKTPQSRRRPVPNPATARRKASLAASLSAPSSPRRRHLPARAKAEIPIDRCRRPAGSCLGGFRTPNGIRKPSPKAGILEA